MKKFISVFLSAAILMCSLVCFSSVSYAKEEGTDKIELNTSYEASFDKTDKLLSKKDKTYYDFYSFELKCDGKVTLSIKSGAKGYLSKYVRYMILDSKSDKVWSPDNKSFKGKWSVKLKKGKYNFVPVYTNTSNKDGKMLGESYSFKLAYKPTLKATELTKVKGANKGFKAEWKKVKGVTGYQLEYSVKKNFAKSEKVKIKGAKNIKTAVGELKAKKKYYVRVRAYRTFTFGEKKKTYYSKWSKAETVKTK